MEQLQRTRQVQTLAAMEKGLGVESKNTVQGYVKYGMGLEYDQGRVHRGARTCQRQKRNLEQTGSRGECYSARSSAYSSRCNFRRSCVGR